MKRFEEDKNQAVQFNTISCIFAIGLVIILDCNALVKILVIIGIIALYLCSILRGWNKEKWVLLLILCISLINVYCECRIYIPYRLNYSTSYNKQCGFSTTQVSYTYNSGNSDSLLCAILKDKDVFVYGQCEMYQRYIEQFSKEVLDYNFKIKVDWLIDKQDSFLDMGRINPYNAVDCFDEDEIEILREIRNDNKPRLYVSSDSVVDENDIIIAVDYLHNIYVITEDMVKEMKDA